jgi:F-type H+-transporting ATPase subunit a
MSGGEIPNLVTLLAEHFKSGLLSQYLYRWENIIFSLIALAIISVAAYLASRKTSLIPSRFQAAVEFLVSGIDDFVCGIIGPKGRRYTPFIGTLLIYILLMNLFGLVPFMKSSTTSWSITLALALIVFIYVQYAGIKELGFLGYIDHLLGKPRGIMAFSVVMPLLMLFLHVVSELVRPISLSLRLRSNIWGDDMLMSLVAGFGIKGMPLLLFNSLLAILASVVQAVVFCLLTTIYFALVLTHEEEEIIKG